MTRVAATLLSLEAVVVLLAIPVAVAVADVDPSRAIPVGVVIALICFVAAGTVRRGRPGFILGSAAQVAALATGFVVPAMFFLGGLFALMWFVLLRIGPEVEARQNESE